MQIRNFLLAITTGLTVLASAAPTATGSNGAVASRSPVASDVGVDIMKVGGNAVDAAVAVGFALAVTYPSAGNIGGGGFLVIRLADGTVVTNDHREAAPAAARRDMYLDGDGNIIEGLSTASHLAVGVPGTVDGLLAALERYGSMPREAVIAPAIRLAREGFALPADLAAQFARRAEQFAQYPASARQFTGADGSALEAGDIFRQEDLAKTLERVSKDGREGFYAGETADLIVAEMQRGGGLITHADLLYYKSRWRAPIRGSYRGYEIFSMPPPSSGGVLLVQMLNMLEPFDLRSMGFNSAAHRHLMIEAERRAYADRAEHLGDPDFYDVPVEMLTDKEYARYRFQDFEEARATRSESVGAGFWPEESFETTHASVADGLGNVVSYTTTLNLGYGAKMVVDGAGFLLNNEMDDFSSKENTANSYGLLGRAANAIEPGKRMLSSMTPTIVLDAGEPILVTGSPGGSTIITTVFQVIVNALDFGMNVADAVASPRMHHQWQPDRVVIEPDGLPAESRTELEAMGHVGLVDVPWGRGIGDANSLERRRVIDADGRESWVVNAAADPRNEGGASAF